MKRPSWPKISPSLVQKNLTGHKILGLALAGLMYLICLSGSATVFYVELQRWESANLPEVAAPVRPEAVAAAIADARRLNPKSLAVYAPGPDNPRLSVYLGETVRAYDAQGRYAGPGAHPALDALTALHYALHLPSTIGLLIVGLAGVGLLALILGGLLAHPRILKDAFLWRFRQGGRLARTDLHNRIGVWAAPFHIVIALTGAMIGISSIVLLAAAWGFHGGDTAKAAAPLYGGPPAEARAGQMTSPAIVRALTELQARIPDATPTYISLNAAGTDHESLTVTADLAERLVYGDTYEFDGKGAWLGSHHLADGAAGQQIYASLYRLHFGSFGGAWVKWAYLALGLGLCMVSATGMDIWLAKAAQKGRPHPRLRRLWIGFVWASPAAMATATVLTMTATAPFVPVFWGLLTALSLGALALRTPARVSALGVLLAGLSLLALPLIHVARFQAVALSAAGLWPNLSFAVLGLALVALAVARGGVLRHSPRDDRHPAQAG